ncbi:MAG: thiamine-phosphate kinase [Bacteroidia bacterium]|nr:thiamine-phosphate kinase [Bacteroidia bacterium]
MLDEQEPIRTPISQFGEFGLIEHLTQFFPPRHAHVIKAVGDDAAVVRMGDGSVQVFTTDLLLEGVHFDLAYVPLKHLGYKAVAVNLSDVVAMNAIPYGITVSVGVSSRFPVEAMEELYAGIQLACDQYQVDLLGGDTSSSRQGLVLSVTAFGTADEQDIVYRSGARPDDLICVTGDLGAAYAGLLVLEREKNVYIHNPNIQPDLETLDYVIGRQLKPEARLDMIQLLQKLGIKPTSMMDVSDGVASELHHLCRQSRCGALIYSAKLPIDFQTISVAEDFKMNPSMLALNGGEDYELIFTIPVADFDKIKDQQDITIIGHMTAHPGSVEIVLESNQVVPIEAQGWQHFSTPPFSK